VLWIESVEPDSDVPWSVIGLHASQATQRIDHARAPAANPARIPPIQGHAAAGRRRGAMKLIAAYPTGSDRPICRPNARA
jgi:hypothetical protein